MATKRGAPTSYHFGARTDRASTRWQPPFQYQCSRGHWVEAERATTRCPAYVHGERCSGKLRPARTEKIS